MESACSESGLRVLVTMEDFANLTIQSLWLVLTLLILPLGVGLIVSVLISVFQGMTQIQDRSLTAIPRILVVLLVSLITLPWMLSVVTGFAETTFDLMLKVGNSGP